MEMNFERAGSVETIALSRRPSVVAIVVVAMGALLVLQVVAVFATRTVTLPLIALLVIAATSAGWLSLIALEAIMPVKVTMDKDGITIARLLGTATYLWGDVADAKIVPSAGLLSDDPKAEPSGRMGVGLFLRSRKTPRLHELDADVMVFGASDDHSNELFRTVDRINDFRTTIGAGRPDPSRRIRKAAPITAPSTFRRPRSAA